MQARVPLSKIVYDYMRELPFWKKECRVPPIQNIQGQTRELSRDKQKQLEALCNKLFERQELTTSGRLQLLGLAKVKQRVGHKRWPGLRNVIYTICEDTIKKYISRGDMYIRYRDESYMLVFTTATPKESELKTSLIAEEIKRRLFEEEGIEDIEVVSQTTQISNYKVSPGLSMMEAMDIAFEENYERSNRKVSPVRAKPSLKVIEIEAFSEEKRNAVLDLGVRIEETPFRAVHYIPVWDQARGRLIAHLCLAKGYDYLASPFDAHRAYYTGMTAAEKANMDLAVLARIISWMKGNPEKQARFGIICPVRYETLVGVEGKERYRTLCQKIDERMKQFLLFMVLDMPPSIPWLSLSQVVSPLKTYGRVLCGQVPNANADFESLRLAGFDNIGIIHSDKKVDIEAFVAKAKKHMILKTFVLGVDDLETAAEAATAGVSFMAGQAIHGPIPDPAQKPAFLNYPYGRMWQKKPMRG